MTKKKNESNNEMLAKSIAIFAYYAQNLLKQILAI